jgi:hypothetical protein
MKTLINLFTENFQPNAVIPILGLTKTYILKNEYLEKDIDTLINNGDIEKNNDGYKLTSNFIKKWAGSSYKYIPEIAR